MKVIIVFLTIITWYISAGTAKKVVPQEYQKDYILYERSNGTLDIEYLKNSTIETYAKDSDLTFHFYGREQSYGFAFKLHEITNLARTNYNPQKNTLVIVHGWRNTYISPVNTIVGETALLAADINLFVVDWSPIASRTYRTAQGSVVQVGNYIGYFIIQLFQYFGQSLDTVTLVGHSLGAHISGNAGAALGGKIGTIIGLDPAGPLFSAGNTANRLDPTDGIHVKVIHTNDRMLGFQIPMGHSDYYPNGGRTQPGCGIDLAGTCAHSRAYEYYAESLLNNAFLSRSCDSYEDFTRGRCSGRTTSFMGGMAVDTRARGDYFLDTNNRAPYGRGSA